MIERGYTQEQAEDTVKRNRLLAEERAMKLAERKRRQEEKAAEKKKK
jgi:hypothetical protein